MPGTDTKWLKIAKMTKKTIPVIENSILWTTKLKDHGQKWHRRTSMQFDTIWYNCQIKKISIKHVWNHYMMNSSYTATLKLSQTVDNNFYYKVISWTASKALSSQSKISKVKYLDLSSNSLTKILYEKRRLLGCNSKSI